MRGRDGTGLLAIDDDGNVGILGSFIACTPDGLTRRALPSDAATPEA
jgi:hypothetical protein